MKFLITVLCILSSSAAMSEEVVFTGVPQKKIVVTIKETTSETIGDRKSIGYTCIITKLGGKYYWTTRESTELVPCRSGIYLTFVAINGSGYVRIIDPEMKKILGEMADEYDYIEHLLLGLNTVTYFGNGK